MSNPSNPFSHTAQLTPLRELTLRGMILGAIMTVIFTASNVYLGLKVGLTFSSAIPAAVISMAILRAFKDSNILENNMVQTQASAAGCLTAVIFVLPGMVMMGTWQGFPFWLTMGLCATGGMLGVIFSIPLRHAMVVNSTLPYPEGVAAAEILKVGSQINNDNQNDRENSDNPRLGVKELASGGLLAAVVTFATSALKVLADSASAWITAGSAIIRLPLGFSSALLGAGYLIGIAAGIALLVGIIIAWGVAIPYLMATTANTENLPAIDFAMQLWKDEVRFLGAGVIGIAAIWTLITLAKPVALGMVAMFKAPRAKQIHSTKHTSHQVVDRTDQDLPFTSIALITGVLALVLIGIFAAFTFNENPIAHLNWTLITTGVAFTFIFGFLIASACGYMAGLIGSSSSPISGIVIIAVILISLILLVVAKLNGLSNDAETMRILTAFALFTSSAVLAVACIANDNLQDLKTGWLVGATPWKQQLALLIGCVVGAAVIPPVLDLLYQAYGFTGSMPHDQMDASQALAAPQATLVTAIAQGIFSGKLNWTMLGTGIGLGIGLIICDCLLKRCHKNLSLPVLAVGISIYLPPAVNTPLIFGAVLSYLLHRALKKRVTSGGLSQAEQQQTIERHKRRGVLFASGLIVGESLVGVIIAGMIGISGQSELLTWVGEGFKQWSEGLGLLVFVVTMMIIWRRVLRGCR